MYNIIQSVKNYLFPERIQPVSDPILLSVSPFNSEWNRQVCGFAQLEREYATEEEKRRFIQENPIKSIDGAWSVPDRFPTLEENLEINRQRLSH